MLWSWAIVGADVPPPQRRPVRPRTMLLRWVKSRRHDAAAQTWPDGGSGRVLILLSSFMIFLEKISIKSSQGQILIVRPILMLKK